MINSTDNLKQTEKSLTQSDKKRVVINSQQLFVSGNEVIIEHQGNEYRLRITSNDKLILTK